MKSANNEDVFERVILREAELARANEALRHEHFERRRTEKARDVFAALGEKLIDASAPRDAALAILDAADQLFGWDAALVDVFSAQEQSYHPIIRFDRMDNQRREVTPPTGTVPFTPFRKQLHEGGPILILRGDEDEADEQLTSFGETGHRSAALMFAPMKRQGRNIGIVSIQSYQPGLYSQADVDIFQALSDYCCHALERAFTEMTARITEQKLAMLEQSLPVITWVTDSDLRITELSGNGRDAITRTHAAIVGTALGVLIPAPFGGRLEEGARRALATGKPDTGEVKISDQPYRYRIEPLKDENGRLACCMGMLNPL